MPQCSAKDAVGILGPDTPSNDDNSDSEAGEEPIRAFDEGPGVIAGYGICWNIKYESQKQALKGKFVINKLIYNERECQDREGGKSFFQDKEITQSDWELVKRLNKVLGEFYILTKKMEGDIPLAGMMLAEYKCMEGFLEKKMNSPSDVDFRTMFCKMIQKTNYHLEEGLCQPSSKFEMITQS
ncbi:hypothetical protein PSTG_00534 [Puccinia striiformis f. sp. tritici PST-78]|uniref:Uncharacterized protein n=1 Tax=Puccinia striiformis f. sp. tritici PST-78 TaxID=1165861 RepID=A0A0L0W5X9_9BASI|nr:hypothetical protein PSTG_00534 [Puccinia striiformis f. sp. tritici PST-78]